MRASRPSVRRTRRRGRGRASLASYIAMSASASSSSAESCRRRRRTGRSPTLAVVPTVPPAAGDQRASSRMARSRSSATSHRPRCSSASRQDHGELVATEAGQEVAVAQRAPAQHRADARDQLVADRVAQGVVDVLEVVEVEREHRASAVVALARRPARGPSSASKPAAVEQLGERIMVGEVLELALVAFLCSDTSWSWTDPVGRPAVARRARAETLSRTQTGSPPGADQPLLALGRVLLARGERAPGRQRWRRRRSGGMHESAYTSRLSRSRPACTRSARHSASLTSRQHPARRPRPSRAMPTPESSKARRKRSSAARCAPSARALAGGDAEGQQRTRPPKLAQQQRRRPGSSAPGPAL